MTRGFHEGSRELQDRFDTRRLADRIDEVLVAAEIDDRTGAFLARQDMFFLATADAEGRPSCSYKGGDPGFVRVLDPRTLAFPSWDGNGMYVSAGNVAVNPHVGLLFIDLTRGRRVRVEGTAAVDLGDPLLSLWAGAQFVVRVAVRAVYPNCPRYVHRYERVGRSEYVPRDGAVPPAPEWKSAPWARDVLPAAEEEIASSRGGHTWDRGGQHA